MLNLPILYNFFQTLGTPVIKETHQDFKPSHMDNNTCQNCIQFKQYFLFQDTDFCTQIYPSIPK